MGIDGLNEATIWGKRRAKEKGDNNLGVFEACIESKNTFDLFGEKIHQELFIKIKCVLEEKCKKNPSYTVEYPQVIICVKNLECIKENKLIKQEEICGG